MTYFPPKRHDWGAVFWALVLLSLFLASGLRAAIVMDRDDLLNGRREQLAAEIKDMPVDIYLMRDLPPGGLDQFSKDMASVASVHKAHTVYAIALTPFQMAMSWKGQDIIDQQRIGQIMTALKQGLAAQPDMMPVLYQAALDLTVMKTVPIPRPPHHLPTGEPIVRQAWWSIPNWEVAAGIAAIVLLVYAGLSQFRGKPTRSDVANAAMEAKYALDVKGRSPVVMGARPKHITTAPTTPPPAPVRPVPAAAKAIERDIEGARVVFPNVVPPVRPGVMTTVPPMTTAGIDRSIPMQVGAPGWSEYYDSATGCMVILGPSGQRDTLTLDSYRQYQRRAQELQRHNTIFHGQENAYAQQSATAASQAASQVSLPACMNTRSI